MTFDFITDEEFRTTLEADYRELQSCSERQAWKAVLVLSGSIIEAVLVDYLLGQGQRKPDPRSMSLADLISRCRDEGVLSQRTADLSSAIKSYRNLIHPGRTVRLGERADREGATVAQAVIAMIVREVASKRREAYGLTAEQIAGKLETDPTGLSIAEHLLEEAHGTEIERLLLDVVPERYFQAVEDPEAPSDFAHLATLSGLFRRVFNFADEDTKRKAMQRFVAVLKAERRSRVEIYEERFFVAHDLDYLDAEDQELVVAHLLSRIQDERENVALLMAAKGLTRFLQVSSVESFIDSLVRESFSNDFSGTADAARHLLKSESYIASGDVLDEIISRLGAWETLFDQRGSADHLEFVRSIRESYEVSRDIPF